MSAESPKPAPIPLTCQVNLEAWDFTLRVASVILVTLMGDSPDRSLPDLTPSYINTNCR